MGVLVTATVASANGNVVFILIFYSDSGNGQSKLKVNLKTVALITSLTGSKHYISPSKGNNTPFHFGKGNWMLVVCEKDIKAGNHTGQEMQCNAHISTLLD